MADALASSPRVDVVAVAPGNAGTLEIGQNLALDILDPAAVVEAAAYLDSGLVVVGPEAPLAAGVSDALRAAGFRVFGPSRAAARLEVSKSFAREICDAAGIPAARWRRFDSLEPALAHVEAAELPVVVKADGLAAGKGVVVASSRSMAREAVCEFLGGRFGSASSTIIIESFLRGEEASFLHCATGIAPCLSQAQKITSGRGTAMRGRTPVAWGAAHRRRRSVRWPKALPWIGLCCLA